MEYEVAMVCTLTAAFDALSSKVEAQNAKLEKLRSNVTELPDLKEKLVKCKELSERLALAERWRTHIGERLDAAGQKLDQTAD